MANDLVKLNYYEVMDLNPDSAHADSIKSRYLELKSFYSSSEVLTQGIFTPDEVRGLQEILEEAYAVLGNQTLKAIYDEKLLNKLVQQPKSSQASNPAKELETAPVIVEPEVEVQSRFEPSARVSNKTIWKLEYEKDASLENWISSEANWDGASLRRVREYKNADINQLSHFTKINPFYIMAIEAMEPENLPASVFVRGYIIQICRSLGLNEQKVAASYMKAYQQACENKKDIRI
jgi:hypothetical protein